LQDLTLRFELERLGEQDPGALLGARRVRSANRDLAVYVLYQLGVYRNEDIGRVFGVGYTAVTAAMNRAREHLESDSELVNTIRSILSDK